MYLELMDRSNRQNVLQELQSLLNQKKIVQNPNTGYEDYEVSVVSDDARAIALAILVIK